MYRLKIFFKLYFEKLLFTEMALGMCGIYNQDLEYTDKDKNVICDKYIHIYILLHWNKMIKILILATKKVFLCLEDNLKSILIPIRLLLWKVTMKKEKQNKKKVFKCSKEYEDFMLTELQSNWADEGAKYRIRSVIEVRMIESK